MEYGRWVREFPSTIIICDQNGTIIEMNEKAAKVYEKDGGFALIGKNLFDCHPEPAKSKLKEIMEHRKSNSYTIEKNGIKKIIHQSPWYENGNYKGFVEISIEIPYEMPHFIRKPRN